VTEETHYEKHPEADLYRGQAIRSWTPFAYLMRHKRLSTAEAMCQYWFARAMGHHALEQDIHYRFATRPHFDGRNETS
jgi:hypothetical protein